MAGGMADTNCYQCIYPCLREEDTWQWRALASREAAFTRRDRRILSTGTSSVRRGRISGVDLRRKAGAAFLWDDYETD